MPRILNKTMKKLNLISILLFATLFFQWSCNKDEGLDSDCENVLDEWTISSFDRPPVQRQKDIFFVNDNIGYSVGNSGTISKTINGGIDWEVQAYKYIPGEGINPNSLTDAILSTVYFIDNMVGYVGGQRDDAESGAVLLNTTDGGNNWNKMYVEGVTVVYDLFFYDEQNGLGLYYIGDSLFNVKLVNITLGGAGWSEVELPIKRFTSDKFIKTPSGFRLLGEDEEENPLLVRSNDNGQSWEIKNVPSSGPCSHLYFIDDNIGFMSCGLLFYPEAVYQTKDGGDSWEEVDSPFNVSSLIHFNNANEGFIINPVYEYVTSGWETRAHLDAFDVFQTIDGGVEWEQTRIHKDCDFDGASYSLPDKTLMSISDGKVHKFELK